MAEPALWLYHSERASYEGELNIFDPRDGSFVGAMPASTQTQVHAALLSARGAFAHWRTVPAAVLRALAYSGLPSRSSCSFSAANAPRGM